MGAAEVIEALIRIGTVVKDSLAKKGEGGKVDWNAFLQSDDFKKVQKTVEDLIGLLKSADLKKAIEEVDAKQTAMLKGRSVADLPTLELVQYAKLAQVRMLLATEQLTRALNPPFIQWVVDDALPTLVTLAPIVLPLLL
jgi:hypothetical protein